MKYDFIVIFHDYFHAVICCCSHNNEMNAVIVELVKEKKPIYQFMYSLLQNRDMVSMGLDMHCQDSVSPFSSAKCMYTEMM